MKFQVSFEDDDGQFEFRFEGPKSPKAFEMMNAIRKFIPDGCPKVRVHGSGPNKIQAIKAVRTLTGLGLKEAKDLVEAAPFTLESVNVEQALALLKEAGATAEAL